jgi:hypothetical protein
MTGGSQLEPSFRADIGYWDEAAGKPIAYAYEPVPGTEQLAWPTLAKPVSIYDARRMPVAATLDYNGFELIGAPSRVRNFYDPDEVASVYYREAERLLIELTGASRVVIFDHTIRARPHSELPGSEREPILRAHVDNTIKSGPQRIRDLLGSEEARARLSRRFAIVNLWRSIAGAVEELPLGVCCGRSVALRDLVPCEMRYADRTGEIYALGHNPGHLWFYYPGMGPDELLLFKNYDSEADDIVRFTPHSAFVDPTTAPDARRRESIELRTLIFW